MALIRIDYHSQTLDMDTTINVIFPDGLDRRNAPIVFLLHGLSDNADAWMRYTSVERYAMKSEVIVVMPEVQRSFYRDMDRGLDYFSYLTKELPLYIRSLFLLEGKLYAFGLSMGGYGALKSYFLHRDLFSGAAAFSAVVDIEGFWKMRPSKEIPAIMEKILPEDDIFHLAFLQKEDTHLYLSCGTEDALYPTNCRFVKELEKRKLSHKVDFREGMHNWDFWDRSLQDALVYFFGK